MRMMISVWIALTGLICIGLFYQGYVLRNAQQAAANLASNQDDLRKRIQQLESELGALCSASVGAGEHVIRLEQQVQRMVERQNQLEMRATTDRPYSRASQLINRGADTDELVDACGLTRGEAELLIMMQRGAA
jgi:hypothetical protein